MNSFNGDMGHHPLGPIVPACCHATATAAIQVIDQLADQGVAGDRYLLSCWCPCPFTVQHDQALRYATSHWSQVKRLPPCSFLHWGTIGTRKELHKNSKIHTTSGVWYPQPRSTAWSDGTYCISTVPLRRWFCPSRGFHIDALGDFIVYHQIIMCITVMNQLWSDN